jgi:hypothetical protein
MKNVNFKSVASYFAIVMLAIVFFLWLDNAVGKSNEQLEKNKNATKTVQGVVLHGYSCPSGSWIENTNTFPVTVEQRWEYRGGEKTVALNILEPSEKIEINGPVTFQWKVMIYKEKELIGMINGSCPE